MDSEYTETVQRMTAELAAIERESAILEAYDRRGGIGAYASASSSFEAAGVEPQVLIPEQPPKPPTVHMDRPIDY